MKTAMSTAIGTFLSIVALLAPADHAAAQPAGIPNPAVAAKEAAGSRSAEIDRLIRDRSGVEWNPFRISTTPTPPPANGPVRVFPEWEPAGHALVALDSSQLESLSYNLLFGTADRADEVLSASDRLIHDLARQPLLKETPRAAIRMLAGRLALGHATIRLIRSLAGQVRVVVVVRGNPDDDRSVSQLIALLSEFPEGLELVRSDRVRFLSLPIDSKWIRDYGPVFAEGGGQVLWLDSRYNPDRPSDESERQRKEARRGQEELRQLIKALSKSMGAGPGPAEDRDDSDEDDDDKEETARKFDDIIMTFLASSLKPRPDGTPRRPMLGMARPPIELDGGDFLTDGNGIAFTSTHTLQRNGGSTEQFELVLQEYYGARHVVYLRPLPGATIKHIDMFFKIVSPEVLLLGRFPAPSGDDVELALQEEAAQAMEDNLAVLSGFYKSIGREVVVHADASGELTKGKVHIIRVPMPPVRRPALSRVARLSERSEALREQSKKLEAEIQAVQGRARSLEADKRKWEGYAARLSGRADSLREIDEKSSFPPAEVAKFLKAVEECIDDLGDAPELPVASRQGVKRLAAWVEDDADASDAPIAKDELASALATALDASGRMAALSEQKWMAAMGRRSDLVRQQMVLGSRREKIAREIRTQQRMAGRSGDFYRTYLNALHVKTEGSSAVLVPVYRGIDGLEGQVLEMFRSVYSRVYGPTVVIPVPCDGLIEMHGAIHCLVRTVPARVEITSIPSSSRARGVEWMRGKIRAELEQLARLAALKAPNVGGVDDDDDDEDDR